MIISHLKKALIGVLIAVQCTANAAAQNGEAAQTPADIRKIIEAMNALPDVDTRGYIFLDGCVSAQQGMMGPGDYCRLDTPSKSAWVGQSADGLFAFFDIRSNETDMTLARAELAEMTLTLTTGLGFAACDDRPGRSARSSAILDTATRAGFAALQSLNATGNQRNLRLEESHGGLSFKILTRGQSLFYGVKAGPAFCEQL